MNTPKTGTVIAVANQKGGTGKTTTTLNLGAALARFHKSRVLLIDMDPQGSLTLFTGLVPEQIQHHLGGLLARPQSFRESLFFHGGPKSASAPGGRPELAFLPSHPDLEDSWQGEPWKKNLGLLLAKARKIFDFVLVDCPPTLGVLTRAILELCDAVLIPLQCEFMALRGVQLLLKAVESSRSGPNPKLKIHGILPTMFDCRTLHSREVLEEIKKIMAGRIPVFTTTIPKTVRFAEAAVAAEPIFSYAPRHPGAAAYKKLAKEIFKDGQTSQT